MPFKYIYMFIAEGITHKFIHNCLVPMNIFYRKLKTMSISAKILFIALSIELFNDIRVLYDCKISIGIMFSYCS